MRGVPPPSFVELFLYPFVRFELLKFGAFCNLPTT